ncbi:hypothetical protein [Paracoccus rhizosphaerae]|uniref:Uncharacterized protein n=1 Tax=Paracoccus rhizosphaerae TaxID=1133347 RepID=A0ABV6CL40_9RHOB|nr:hypothetical protein [Paracoccus rhizosphaerae]
MSNDLIPRTLTVLAVSEAQDELLCRAVLRAVENGASEDEWRATMRATRKLLSSQFFEMVDHFEADISKDPDVERMLQRVVQIEAEHG